MTEEELNEVIERVYTKALAISGKEDTPKNKFAVENIINNSLVYCNREDVPTQMESVIVQISVEALEKGSIETQTIKRLKEGDREEEYFEDSASAFNHSGLLDMFRKIKSVR